MLTVAQINEQASVLRSKIAVAEGLVLYLKSSYMPSDGMRQPEMYFTRSDFGRVPPAHIEHMLTDLVEMLDDLKAELIRLESTPVTIEPPKPEPEVNPASLEEATSEADKTVPTEEGKTEPVAAEPEPEKPETKEEPKVVKIGTKPVRKETPDGKTGGAHHDRPAAQHASSAKAG